MKTLIFLLFFFIQNVQAWTLAGSLRRGFDSNEITINIAADTCSNAGLSPSELYSLAENVMDKYWNTVPTSSLELSMGSIVSTSLNGVNDLTGAYNAGSNNSILVGCNDDFSDFTDSFISALGLIGCSGTDCRGVVVFNDTSGTNVASQNQATLETTMGHELGHALGLGHSSVKHALMFYSSDGKEQDWLSQDDVNGISYLYPNEKEAGGFAGSCATISFDDPDPPSQEGFFIALLLGFLLTSIASLRSKRRRF